MFIASKLMNRQMLSITRLSDRLGVMVAMMAATPMIPVTISHVWDASSSMMCSFFLVLFPMDNDELWAAFQRGQWACRGAIKRANGGVPSGLPAPDDADTCTPNEAYWLGWMVTRAGVVFEQERVRQLLED